MRRPPPESVLDFGTGVGNSWPFLAEVFPNAKITGLDVSAKSLAVAEGRFPGVARAVCYDGGEIPLAESQFDLIFSACVFHHIDGSEHVPLFKRLKRLLRPGGLMVTFEHNPINPLTRYIVSTCPFDENAILIASRDLKRRQIEAGFAKVDVAYTGFFPRFLSALRSFEPYLKRLPVGAQYYTLAHG
jgi:SAM-dependent methyltransferase